MRPFPLSLLMSSMLTDEAFNFDESMQVFDGHQS